MRVPKDNEIVNVKFEEFNKLKMIEIKYQQLIQQRLELINENSALKRRSDYYEYEYYQLKKNLKSLTKI